MLPTLGRGLRLALTMSLGVGYVAWHGHHHAAFAKGGDDDGGDDDEGGGDDKPDKGGDDETGEEPEDPKDQPAVTAGGLFTINSYPQRELVRPLTMTQGITQIKLSLGTDISAKGAFGTGGLSIEAAYGVTDNFSLIGGLTDAYNFKQFGFYFGFEGALAYDLVDIRLAANVHRSAIPLYCDQDPGAPANCADPTMPGILPNLPDGNFIAGGTKFSLDLGFPFRYAINPQIAIVALQTLISIDFNKVDLDHTGVISCAGTPTPTVCSAMDVTNMSTKTIAVGNGVKPDLNPSIGIATNPIAALSVVIFAQLRVPDFDTSAGSFQIPVTGRVEFSPSQKLDVGLEFTLLNIKPPDPQTAIDNRFLSLFAQARF